MTNQSLFAISANESANCHRPAHAPACRRCPFQNHSCCTRCVFCCRRCRRNLAQPFACGFPIGRRCGLPGWTGLCCKRFFWIVIVLCEASSFGAGIGYFITGRRIYTSGLCGSRFYACVHGGNDLACISGAGRIAFVCCPRPAVSIDCAESFCPRVYLRFFIDAIDCPVWTAYRAGISGASWPCGAVLCRVFDFCSRDTVLHCTGACQADRPLKKKERGGKALWRIKPALRNLRLI